MFNVAKALENFCNAYEGEVTFTLIIQGDACTGEHAPA